MTEPKPYSKPHEQYWIVDTKRKADTKGKRKGKSRLKYFWDKIIPKIEQIFNDRRAHGLETTERKLYYELTNLEGEGVVFPAVKKAYGSLVAKMTYLREIGRFPMDCLIDDRHPVVEIDDRYVTPESWIRYYLKRIEKMHIEYHEKDKNFPRWWNQKNYVELWTEKQAMIPDLDRINKNYNLQVRLQAFGGPAGTTNLNDCVKRLKKQIRLGKNIHILYTGDNDPTGNMIDKNVKKRLLRVKPWKIREYAEEHGVTFDIERIAITKEQIKEYDLPWDPDKQPAEVQEKILNDPRTRRMILEEGQAYACSLDSFPARHLEAFEKLVVSSVNFYFDKKVYKKGLKKHKKDYNQKVIRLDRDNLVEELDNQLSEREQEYRDSRTEEQEDEQSFWFNLFENR